MTCNLTIFNLLNFMPLNDNEKQLYNFDKDIINRLNTDLDKGFFYLGGQVKMKHNDLINLDSIQKVRVIYEERNREYGGPCNSFEAASINNHNDLLNQMEEIIIAYTKIIDLREL